MVVTAPEKSPAVRATGIGGSDAAAACGLSKFKTPYELWQEKVGLVERDQLANNDSVRFGQLLEGVVADEFARRRNVEIRRDRRTIRNVKHAFAYGHIDRRLVKVAEGLEVKTAGLRMAQHWGEEGSDEVPLDYWAQAAHYLAITGWACWHIAVLIGGQDFRMFQVPRDEEGIALLMEREKYFWDCVVNRRPPDPMTLADVSARWPSHIIGKQLVATAEIQELVSEVAARKQHIRSEEALLEMPEFRLRAVFEDNEVIVDAQGRPLATYRRSKSSTVFDEAAFAIEHPDLHSKYMVEKPGSRRLLLK